MSDAPPRVAVIVPAHNGERLLPQTLESILAQTYEDWEVVLVDDASTDGTLGVAESFARRAPGRFTVVRLDQNVGVGGARSAGTDRSGGGELLCLLDQDDLWDERYLDHSVAAFDQALAAGRRVGIVSSNALILDEDGVSGETWWDRNGWVEPVDLDAMIRRNYLMARSLFSRAAFEDAGGTFARDCGGSDDYDLWLRILEAGYEVIGVPRAPRDLPPARRQLLAQPCRDVRGQDRGLQARAGARCADALPAPRRQSPHTPLQRVARTGPVSAGGSRAASGRRGSVRPPRGSAWTHRVPPGSTPVGRMGEGSGPGGAAPQFSRRLGP